ncbi:hypothetical protein CUR178_07965 [Leishmania enriettii]|uniref:CHCH domain-containing protein n=1 Tax=Leishmania enriettii TaxID=5663 RepID=A0A836I214_LEIEN|nr:hypothetical protein CUR178_07965 [Leishmania enriettii]
MGDNPSPPQSKPHEGVPDPNANDDDATDHARKRRSSCPHRHLRTSRKTTTLKRHTFLSRFSFIWSPHDGGAGSCDYGNGCSTASGAESLPPSVSIGAAPSPQGPGDMLQLSRFTGTSPPAAASPSPVSLFQGRQPHSEVSPLNPTPQQRLGPLPDDHAQASAPRPHSTKPGLCAPQMLCYRQCLEVNPDLKSNCTLALDRYVQCQEDSTL